jgi:hypothetical protein
MANNTVKAPRGFPAALWNQGIGHRGFRLNAAKEPLVFSISRSFVRAILYSI